MADNVAVTEGSGKTIATDDVSGVQYQKIKIDVGGDGASVPLDGGQEASSASVPVVLSTEQEALLDAIIAKDFATQTTLAALLAKVIAAPATEAKQDTLIAKDFATQTTLAAILAKIIAAPATEAKQDTLIAKDFATQTTLAALLAKFAGGTVIGDVNLGATDNAVLDAMVAVLGATNGAAVVTDADGTIQQYLRGLVKLLILPAALGTNSGLKVDSVLPRHIPANLVSGLTAAMTGTTSTSLLSAPGSSLYNYITEIAVSNSHATVGTDIELQDGNGGTTFWVLPAAAVYGGAVIHFDPPLKQPTSNTALYVKNTTTGASTRVSANGYKGA